MSVEPEVCEQTVINRELVEGMKEKLIDEKSIMRLVDFYKLFSDMTRT